MRIVVGVDIGADLFLECCELLSDQRLQLRLLVVLHYRRPRSTAGYVAVVLAIFGLGTVLLLMLLGCDTGLNINQENELYG